MSGTLVQMKPTKPVAGDSPSKPVKSSQRGWKRSAFSVVFVIGFLIASLQLAFTAAYSQRVLPGVTVANIAVGGLSISQSQQKLAKAVSEYSIHLDAAGQNYLVSPAQAGIKYNFTTTVAQAYLAGRSHPITALIKAAVGSRKNLTLFYVTDPKVHEKLVKQLADVGNNPPQDATVVVQNGVPVAQPDKDGRGLRPDAISQAIGKAAGLATDQPQRLEPTVLKARIRTSDTTSAVLAAKQLIATPIAITYQAKHFQPTLAQVGSWIVFDKSPPDQAPSLIAKVDSGLIKNYLSSISPQINVKPIVAKVNVQNGVATQYQAGVNGVALNADSLAGSIASAVSSKKALTIEAPTAVVPFQTQYNNSVPLPFDKYIEVNLSQQHLWVYQDHQIIFDSPITSGATGAGFPTATGQFAVYAKETNRHLVGYQYGPRYNYDVFVRYWMPFYQGFGLHDASWRSSFGGSDYYYGGSHGCVNLPLATAAFLFSWVDIGTPVWVHN